MIVTKCPDDLKPMEYRVLVKAMDLFPYQELFFTTLRYGNLSPIFSGEQRNINTIRRNENILLLTGIASPKQMIVDLKTYTENIKTLAYSDHHNFTDSDIQQINETFAKMPSPKLIITTEKDEARLLGISGLSDEVRNNIYTLPIRMKFLLDKEETFNDKIIDYVRKNSRNSILVKRKDDNEARNSNNSGNRPRTISF